MEHAIFINPKTACVVAAKFNTHKPFSAAVRPAKARGQLLGYHVCLNGMNITENELEAL